MKALLSIATVAAALLTGCGAVAEATTSTTATKPHKLQDAVPIVDEASSPADLQEDDPGWNCLLHGNKVCGPRPGDEVEAWTRLDPAVFPDNDQDFKIEYLGKGLAGVDFPPSDYYTVPASTGGRVHVFSVEVGK